MKGALGKKELLQVVPLSEYTIRQLELKGEFPKRFPLTDKRVGWNRDEVEQWLNDRQQNPPQQLKAKNNPDVRRRRGRPVKSQIEA
jgi:prophage regulatory protein